jgi:anti-sigma regulatory factor (Ser/Thr protein kinase)
MCIRVPAGCERSSTDAEIKLDPLPEAPAQVREFIRQHLPALGFPTLVDDAMLIAVELVTNSVRYAAAHGQIWLSVRQVGGRALLEVQDGCPDLPIFRDPDYVAERGRGLHVVAALATKVDWAPVDGGKIVWAILEQPPRRA